MRAIRARYDPYEQTRGRVEQLKSLGHSVDKVRFVFDRYLRLLMEFYQVEFIIMGGTFMSMPEEYRNKFVAQLHNALSGFTGTDVDEAVRYVSPESSNPKPLKPLLVTLNRVNQKPSVSRLKLGLTTV